MTVARKTERYEELSTPLFLALTAYLVIAFMRPQDVIPGLGLVRPGLIATAATMVFWLASRSYSHMRDAIFKWQCVLLAVLLIGISVVVNHRFWFNTTLSYLIYIGCLTLGLVAVARFRAGRNAILKLLLVCYLFQTVWAITHAGKGTGAYFTDENDAAAAMIVGGSLAYAMWLHWTPGIWRKLALAAVALSCVGIVATMSRGGFLGFVAAICAVLLFSGRLFKSLLLVAVLGAGSYPFLPDEYKADMKSISDPSDSTRRERIYSWNRAIDLFVKSPVVGIGAGNYPWRVTEVELTDRALIEREGQRLLGGRVSHSLYFTLLPENGLLGVVAYFALVFIVFQRAWRVIRRPRRDTDDPAIRTIAQFIVIALIGYSVAAVFISVLWYPHFWLMAGLAMLLSPKAKMDSRGVISWATESPASRMQRRKLPAIHSDTVDQHVDRGRVHGRGIGKVNRKPIQPNRR
jgi:O-antigen ligase